MLTFLRDRKVRDILWQAAATLVTVAVIWFFVRNASENMVKAGIASGFKFLWRDSGIEVPFNLTGYRPSDNILALLWTGIVNTLLVSAAAIVVATAIGFTVGLLRLSRNWLLSSLAGFYIEFVRNIPLLFFILFWYFGVLAALPTPRDSADFLGVIFLNRRGLSIPTPNDVTGLRLALAAIVVLMAVQFGLARWAARRQARTGRDFPVWPVGLVLCGVLPILALVAGGMTTAWDVPTLRGFNYRGGFVLVPAMILFLVQA
ncbi:MAG: ABC transporter permease subunit, partial [Proteobacteria bacterium]|nr:ABC transporter permease subunit [Pseudomonadota bacterium]